MKKLITSAALLLTSAFAFAQESYTVKMNTKVEGLPAEAAAFGESEMITYIKGEKIKTEVSSMMGTQTQLYDGKIHTFLSDAMGKKTGYTATNEELEAASKSDKGATSKPKIEYTNEKKTIAGYECTKAIITSVDKDKKENKIYVWATEKIKFDMSKVKKGSRNDMMDLGDLKGYPLEMDMQKNVNNMDLKISITTSEVTTKPVDDSVFAVSTDGYTMSSYKEALDRMKSMGGRGGN